MERIAWRSVMQSERGVVCEKGAVAKKAVFSLTNIVNRKRAFCIDKEEKPYKKLALITALFCPYMEPLCHVYTGKTGEAATGKRDYRNVHAKKP